MQNSIAPLAIFAGCVSRVAIALVLFCGFACSFWPHPKTDIVDCAKEAGRNVWAIELDHVRELISSGVSYDSVASYAAGLVARFGQPFVVCLWEHIRAENAALQSSPESIRATSYADRWLSENAR